ncbi:hypothetical protein AMS68_008048 [Peltaster fructicola]|uniref:YDG domain-containing protein n=1 Tax=Peltaster fructicola TaxID=286661 RepID=A0A6H0Y6Q5_9PEZI|nr:hypothetical protein AMS68_008048 [Peltaster fructicola]
MASIDAINANIEYLAAFERQRDHIRAEAHQCLRPLCVQLLRHRRCDPERLARLDKFLDWLAEEATISPTLARETRLGDLLRLIYEPGQRWRFPEEQQRRAQELHQRWSASQWGQAEEDARRSQVVAAVATRDQAAPRVVYSFDDPEEEDTSRRSNRTTTTSAPAPVRIPDQSHPIFGREGIMWGLAFAGSSQTIQINPECLRKDFRVFGHNGLTIGRWWPRQLAALVHGAHGSSQGGIAGTQNTGAYSIVVSGTYDGLDRDEGNTLYYSGSNSHNNRDQNSPPPSTTRTLALKASIGSQQPVRVLRSASGESRYCPMVGLRYDGLYRVVSCNNKKNAYGGIYEQFKLERLEGQEPLSSITTPTDLQVRDFGRINLGYRSRNA